MSKKKTDARKISNSEFKDIPVELFIQFARNSSQGFSISDEEGHIFFSNDSFRGLFGYRGEDNLPELSFSDLLEKKEKGRFHREILPKLKKGEKWKGERTFISRKGDEILAEEEIYLVESSNGPLIANMITDVNNFRDIKKKLEMEKEYYRNFTESLGDWVWEIDLNGIHTYSNTASTDIIGYTPEEVVGMDSMDLWPQRARTEEQRKRHLDTLKKGEKWSNYRALFKHKDGSDVYLLSSAVPLYNEDGDLIGYRGIDRDYTENVKANEALHESREKLNTIIETAREVIFTTDITGKIDFISNAVSRTIGYDPDEFIGKTIVHKVHPADQKVLMEIGEKALGSAEDQESTEYRIENKEGKYVWQRATFSPKTNNEGEVTGLVGVSFDVTSKKETEDRVHEYNDILKIINKILRHDLTNNLFMIRTALDHFKVVRDDKWLESVEVKTRMSFDLIEQMKNLESIVSSGGSLRIVDINEALERIRMGFEIPIQINCPEKIKADDAFYSLMENLIRNAVIHGNTDSLIIRSRTDEDGMVVIEVIDQGVGVKDEIKDKIFNESYYHGTTGGSGLGLFIVKRTIERYGGTISVSDNEPRGAIFTIKIPKA